ncbi:UNVERIFIED_CONTAM: hypothetical protein NY603_38430, partial [Bacteroidetes bacterium 56_B9]
AVRMTVQIKTTNFTRQAIADHTAMETTDTPVMLASSVVGWYVADKVKPHTDLAVDKTADFINAKREKRQARKSAKKSETE